MNKEYYRPLPDCVTIEVNAKLTESTGRRQLGLYAVQTILDEQIIGLTHIKDHKYPDGLIRTPLGGFFNHSEDPNCKLLEFDGELHMMAITDIKIGEELTCTYKTYDPTK